MSAPAQTELSVQQFLTKNGMTPRAPPSLVTRSQSCPKQFFLLLLKKVLKGKRFADVEEVNKEWQKHQRHQNRRVRTPSSGKRLDGCTASDGEHSEGG